MSRFEENPCLHGPGISLHKGRFLSSLCVQTGVTIGDRKTRSDDEKFLLRGFLKSTIDSYALHHGGQRVLADGDDHL